MLDDEYLEYRKILVPAGSRHTLDCWNCGKRGLPHEGWIRMICRDCDVLWNMLPDHFEQQIEYEPEYTTV